MKSSEPVRNYRSARDDQEIPYTTPSQRVGEAYQRRFPPKHPFHEWGGRAKGEKKVHHRKASSKTARTTVPKGLRKKSNRPCRSTHEIISRPSPGAAPQSPVPPPPPPAPPLKRGGGWEGEGEGKAKGVSSPLVERGIAHTKDLTHTEQCCHRDRRKARQENKTQSLSEEALPPSHSTYLFLFPSDPSFSPPPSCASHIQATPQTTNPILPNNEIYTRFPWTPPTVRVWCHAPILSFHCIPQRSNLIALCPRKYQ